MKTEWVYWLLLLAVIFLVQRLVGQTDALTKECLEWRSGLPSEGDRQHVICPDDYLEWQRKGTFPQR